MTDTLEDRPQAPAAPPLTRASGIWKPLISRIQAFFLRGDGVFALALLVVVFPVYFYHALAHPYPTGYAGLFSLMADLLVQNQFHPAGLIPYYSPEGLPFVYPPLGIGLYAFAVGILNIPRLVYLRFIPPFFTLLSLIPVYSIARFFLKSKPVAVTAVLLSFLSPAIFFYNIGAGGIVRAAALFFALMGLWLAFRGLPDGRRRDLILSGGLFAAVILTHLSYIPFFLLSLGLYLLICQRTARAAGRAGFIVALGLLLSAPWWVEIAATHGLAVFLNAMNSHRNADILLRFTEPLNPFWLLRSYAAAFIGLVPLGGIAVFGVLILLLRKQFFVPAWFLALLFLTGESDRYLVFIGGMAAAYFLYNLVSDLVKTLKLRRGQVITTVVLAALIAASLVSPLRQMARQVPGISEETIRLSQWFQENTPAGAAFLGFARDEDITEWLPYYLERPLALPYWGTEWTGIYPRQGEILEELIGCYDRQSFTCAANVLDRHKITPDYLVLPVNPHSLPIERQIEASAEWKQVYRNEGYTVWEAARLRP